MESIEEGNTLVTEQSNVKPEEIIQESELIPVAFTSGSSQGNVNYQNPIESISEEVNANQNDDGIDKS